MGYGSLPGRDLLVSERGSARKRAGTGGGAAAAPARDAGSQVGSRHFARTVSGRGHRAAASGSVIRGNRPLPLGDAGDREHHGGDGIGQGLDSKVAEPQRGRLPPIAGDGGPGDPLNDWTHKYRALGRRPRSSGELMMVSMRSATPSFRYCFTREFL